MSLKTPIAFLIFDRPDVTRLVFDEIAQQRPQTLLVIGDGPRPDDPNSANRVDETRQIIQRVDWDCDIRTNFSDTNLGCRRRISSGLDWVFENFERAIVLEDDCIPDPTFFSYCESLLDRYADDPRVSAISGDNFQFGQSRTDASYYFSKYPHCWGWASWRRAWQTMDLELQRWPALRDARGLETVCDSPEEVEHWTHVFDTQYAGNIDSWAFPWTFSCFANGGLTALPNVNLVSNIGFGNGATHTRESDHPLANLPTKSLSPIEHAGDVERHVEADQFSFQKVFYRPPPTPAPRPRFFKKLYNSVRKRLLRRAKSR